MLRLLVLFLTTGATLAQVKVLIHATVIDGTGSAPIPDAVMIVKDGRIVDVGPQGSVTIPRGGEVIDLKGKTLIPGIINLHGHVGLTRGLTQHLDNYTRENVAAQLRTYASYGVTTTTSLGLDTDLMRDVREQQRQGRLQGARVYTALQGFTTLNGYPTHIPGVKGLAQEVGTADQARAAVKSLAGKGGDVVKMWVDDHHDTFQKLSPAVYAAIIDEAHRHKMKVFAHVYELSDAKGLVDAGVDVLAHSVRDMEVDDELIGMLKRKGVTCVATLSREQSTFVYADPPGWLSDPFLTKSTTPEIIQGVRTRVQKAQAGDPESQINREGSRMAMHNLKKLSDAGVRIGFGTDTGVPGRFQGFFEHWEMELMVQAGLTPMQVVESFSRSSAEALGIADDVGSLTPGKLADMVVLDKSPLDSIRNTRSIHAVYLAGERFE